MPTLKKLYRVGEKEKAPSHAAAGLRSTEDDAVATTANDEEDVVGGSSKTTTINSEGQEEEGKEESNDVFYNALSSLAEDSSSSTHSQVTIAVRKKRRKTDEVINLCDDSIITSVVKNNTTERPSRACRNKKRYEIDFSLLDYTTKTYSSSRNNIKMEPYYSNNDNNSNNDNDDSTSTIIASKRSSSRKGIQTTKQYVKDEYTKQSSFKDDEYSCKVNYDNRKVVSSILDRSSTTIVDSSIPILEGYGSNISNLSKVEPKVNMLLDLLDDHNIWNIATIVHVSHERVDISNKWKCNVTLRYEGWGSKWDMILNYPNARLARIFTYTKQVRCFVMLMERSSRGSSNSSSSSSSSRKLLPPDYDQDNTNNWTNVWPCKVSFRVPHQNRSSACNLLRKECKVFIQPYMTHTLPYKVQQCMINGGQWVDTIRLLEWKEIDVHNPSSTGNKSFVIVRGLPPPNGVEEQHVSRSKVYRVNKEFCDAYTMAKSDWIEGYLPSTQVLSSGVLLKEKYRISMDEEEEESNNGFRYSGSFLPPIKTRNNTKTTPRTFGEETSSSSSSSRITHSSAAKPTLPTPIVVTDKSCYNQCVRHLPVSNRWAGVLNMAGNDLFVGSYVSQSEAQQAVQMALAQARKRDGQDDNGESQGPNDNEYASLNDAQLVDLFSIPAESIISAFEETDQKKRDILDPPFRLGEWIDQHYQRVYHRGNCGTDAPTNNMFTLAVPIHCDGILRNKRRKQSHPKRLKLV